MTDESFLIRCPGCGHTKQVEMAVGQRLECDVCQTTFYAPVVSTNAPGTPVTDVGHNAPVPRQRSQTGQPAAGQEVAPAGLDATVSATGQVDQQGRGVPAENATSPSSAETALPAGDGPAGTHERPPNSAAADESAWHGHHAEPSGRIWTWISAVAGTVIVALSAAVCASLLRDWIHAREAASVSSAKTPIVRPQQPAVANLRWSDAADSSQMADGIQVRIQRAVYGAVRVKDINNRVMSTEDDNLLAVTIAVTNRGTEPCPFHNWYSNTFESETGEPMVPELTDSQSHAFSLLRFDDVASIEGQRWADEIDPQQSAQDTIVFLIPRDVDRKNIQFFRLSLPAAAVGFSDTFRFEIPVTMIEGF